MTDLGSIHLDNPGKQSPGHEEIAELAGRQHGVVASRQLFALGFTRGAMEYRVASGSLHQLYRGVYAVGWAGVSPLGRVMAAVLACGPAAVASHHAAVFAWALRVGLRALVDVTAPRSRHGQAGIRLHRVRSLDP